MSTSFSHELPEGATAPPLVPDIRRVLVPPQEARDIASGKTMQLQLGELGVMSIVTVVDRGAGDGHCVTGFVDNASGERYSAFANLYTRSLLGKLLGRPVSAYVSLGLQLENPEAEERP